MRSGDYTHALNVCETELLIAQQSTDKKGPEEINSLNLLLNIAEIHHSLGNANKEKEFLALVNAHPLFDQTPEIKYRWLRKMGQRQYFEKDYQGAYDFLNRGLALARQSGNELDLAKSYNDVGLVESQLGDFKSALSHYQKSLQIKQTIGDRYKVATTLNNIGLIHIKLEKLDLGINYYEQALENFLLYTTEKDFDQRVFSNLNHLYEDLAVAYSQVGNREKETQYRIKAQQSIEQKNSEREKARAYINLASLWLDSYANSETTYTKAKLEEALALLEKATELQESGSFDLRMELDSQKANFYHLKKDNEKSITFANSSLLAAKEKYDLLTQAKMLLILSESYQAQAPQTSLKYLRDYSQIREKFIAQKYDTELKSIQVEIEKSRVEKALSEEQLTNMENQSAIQSLTNWILSTIILLLLSTGLAISLYLKKQKEKQTLLQSLKFHQQQLILLEGKYSDENDSASIEDEEEQRQEIEPKSTLQLKQRLREALVNTMVNAVSIWESHTGTNKIELAEKSKIWTVSVDSGSLRTRSLDKYLSLKKIPLNPRWRNVVGTCHFILADADIPVDKRKQLNADLDELMSAVKSLSLNGPAAQ